MLIYITSLAQHLLFLCQDELTFMHLESKKPSRQDYTHVSENVCDFVHMCVFMFAYNTRVYCVDCSVGCGCLRHGCVITSHSKLRDVIDYPCRGCLPLTLHSSCVCACMCIHTCICVYIYVRGYMFTSLCVILICGCRRYSVTPTLTGCATAHITVAQ